MHKLTAAIGTLIAVALLAAACGGDADNDAAPTPSASATREAEPVSTTSSAPPVPTSAAAEPTISIVDALNKARQFFTNNPPWSVHDMQSVAYVESTVGRARNLFDPGHFTPAGRWFADEPDETPVWVVLASGDFQFGNRFTMTPTPYSSVWIVIRKGEEGTHTGSSNEEYDLSQLGTVVEVPVPLPEFPTPVALGTPPAIDTSTWQTYTSPYHGFSIMSPLGWTLQAPGHISQPVYFFNPQAAAERARRVAEGITEFPTLQVGEAWIEVGPGPPGPFDVDSLSTICPGITDRMFNGLRAGQCGSGASYTIYAEQPDGGVLQIVTRNIGFDSTTAQVLEAIHSTIVFDQE